MSNPTGTTDADKVEQLANALSFLDMCKRTPEAATSGATRDALVGLEESARELVEHFRISQYYRDRVRG